MTEAEKMEMLQEADSIMRAMEDIIKIGPKDMLQAMFEFTKLAARASRFNERSRALDRRDSELRNQGKETGWEKAVLERQLNIAYELLQSVQSGQPSTKWNLDGWLFTYRQYYHPIEE